VLAKSPFQSLLKLGFSSVILLSYMQQQAVASTATEGVATNGKATLPIELIAIEPPELPRAGST
jgi:hypothetical protein